MEYPSKYIQAAVEGFSRLPGIGKKTALRLALHILKAPEHEAELLGQAIIDLRKNTRRCDTCGNLSDDVTCNYCLSPRRDDRLLCVVEETRDLLAIEKTGQYQGRYHVLGGIISPVEGIGPDRLNIDRLVQRVEGGTFEELILALPSSMEGETTAFYLARRLSHTGLKMSNIARGIPVGTELEFADELTLGRSLLNRMAYTQPGKTS